VSLSFVVKHKENDMGQEFEEPGESLSGVVVGAMIGGAMWLVLLALAYVACAQQPEPPRGGAQMRAPFDAGDLT
jgi:hypothetical protein